MDWNPAGSMTIRTAEDRCAQTRTNHSAPQPGSWAHLDSADDRWRRQCGAAGAERDALLIGIVRQFRARSRFSITRASICSRDRWTGSILDACYVTQSHGCPAVKQAHAIAEELLATRQQGSRGRRRGPREFRSSASARQNCASNHNNCERQYHAGIPGRCTIDGDVAAREKF